MVNNLNKMKGLKILFEAATSDRSPVITGFPSAAFVCIHLKREMLARPLILSLMHTMELSPSVLGMTEFPQSGCPSCATTLKLKWGPFYPKLCGSLNFKGGCMELL